MPSGFKSIADYGSTTLFVSIFVGFGGFLFGYDLANISGVMAMGNWLSMFGYIPVEGAPCALEAIYEGQRYCVSSINRSLITSLLSIGTFVGALSGALVADKLGRRGGLMFASGIFTVGAAIQTGVESIPLLIVGRIVAGMGVGLISMLVPMMQAESAPPQIRGAIVSVYQLAITVGILISQGADLGTQNIQSPASWRIPVGLQILWGLLLGLGTYFLPESPRHLVNQGKLEQGRASLARLRGRSQEDPVVIEEYNEIVANLEFEKSLGQATYADCFKGNMFKRSMAGILVQMFQQLTGVNFVFYYGTQFFVQAGIEKPYLITIATGLVNTFMTFPGIYMVEKLGRRKFLIGGAIWMSLCQLIIGILAVTNADSPAANHVLVGLTLVFIAGFASTWGPGAWVLISELFPLQLRGKAMSLATASNWWWNWVIAFVIPYITDQGYGNMGSKIAFIWFGTSLCAAVWTYFCVPETVGLSLEELDEMFATCDSYRKTPNWKPSGTIPLHADAVLDKSATRDEKIY